MKKDLIVINLIACDRFSNKAYWESIEGYTKKELKKQAEGFWVRVPFQQYHISRNIIFATFWQKLWLSKFIRKI